MVRHVVEVNRNRVLLLEIDTLDTDLGELVRFNCRLFVKLGIGFGASIKLHRGAALFVSDLVNAVLLSRLVDLCRYNLIKAK